MQHYYVLKEIEINIFVDFTRTSEINAISRRADITCIEFISLALPPQLDNINAHI